LKQISPLLTFAWHALNSTKLLGTMEDGHGKIQPVLSTILNELMNLNVRYPLFNGFLAILSRSFLTSLQNTRHTSLLPSNFVVGVQCSRIVLQLAI
jgi:hypothetical protein